MMVHYYNKNLKHVLELQTYNPGITDSSDELGIHTSMEARQPRFWGVADLS
jgi:hypothetical protein